MVSKSVDQTLDQRATRVAAEAAEINRERQQIETDRIRRLTEHQAAVDQAAVDAWKPRDLDRAVTDAQRELGRVIAEDPITQATAAYLLAQSRRSVAWREHLDALAQLGRPTAGAQMPGSVSEPNIGELIIRHANQQADDQLAAETTDRYTHRNTIPTEEQS